MHSASVAFVEPVLETKEVLGKIVWPLNMVNSKVVDD
jgi:hypothetical protein